MFNKNIRLNVSATLLILSVLGGCNSSTVSHSGVQQTQPSSRTLLSTFPYDGQFGVSSVSLLTLLFEGEGDPPSVSLLHTGNNQPVTTRLLDDNDGRTTYEMVGLEANTSYRITIGSTNARQSTTVTFQTAATQSAPGQSPRLVESNIESSKFPLTDRSSYYLSHSEWLNPGSVNDAAVTLKSAQGEHPVRVLVNKENISISPVEPLPNAGPWTLSVDGLYDLSGVPVPAYTREFTVTPLGSLSRINVESYRGPGRQSVADVRSTLFGDSTITFDSATGVYLGDPSIFEGYQPVLIKKGTEFTGSAIDLQLGGVTATSLNSGPLRFIVLNDSVGYLQKNPLTDTFEAPQAVQLRLDLAVAATEPRTQSVVTQYILNGRANGLSRIVDGQLIFSLTAVSELSVLESAKISANLDLVLATVNSVTTDFNDVTGPSPLSSIPANGYNRTSQDQTILITFDEPLDVSSVKGKVSLTDSNGLTIPVNTRVDGGRLIIEPQALMSGATSYTVTVNAGITDLVGNPGSGDFSTSFRTLPDSAGFSGASRIEGLIPGVPCPLINADLQSGIAGYCKVPEGGNRSQAYSIFQLPANQPVELWLNSIIEPASGYAATSCDELAPISVTRVVWSSGEARCQSAVPGKVTLYGNNLRFVPESDLTVGASYQLVINTGNNSRCDNGELCGLNGLPVDADPLDGTIAGGAGNIVIPFTAVDSADGIYQPLLSVNRTDIDANGTLDNGEITAEGSSIELLMDLCDAEQCTDLFPFSSTNVCPFPGAQPTLPGYSCNPDTPRTQSFLKSQIAGSSILYSDTVLPITIGTAETDPQTGEQRLPVRVPPGILFSTKLDIALQALVEIPIPTGYLTFRTRQNGQPGSATTPVGYISTDPALGAESRFNVTLDVLADAPQLEIPLGGDHSLKNKELSITLSSLITYNNSGQFLLNLRNEEVVKIPMKVSDTPLGAADGDIIFEIPKGRFRYNVISRPYLGQ